MPVEFDGLIERIGKSQPDVLVCHSPTRGMLDVGGYYTEPIGIGHLTNFLSYRPHKVKYMFHGHVHEKGGRKAIHKEMGVTFVNGARCCALHEI